MDPKLRNPIGRQNRRPGPATSDCGHPGAKAGRRAEATPRSRRRTGHRLARLGTAAMALLALWIGGLILFVEQIPQAVEHPAAVTDAIVVLTGGSDRVQEGLRLIAEKRARKLFISGVYDGVDVAELLRSMAPAQPEMTPTAEQIACCVILGHSADDTEGNARETAAWMAKQHFRSLRLVTADYHMPRSLLEFRRVMPDLIIRPHPVFPPQIKRKVWWRSPGTALLMLKEYNKFLAALVRSLIVEPSAGGET